VIKEIEERWIEVFCNGVDENLGNRHLSHPKSIGFICPKTGIAKGIDTKNEGDKKNQKDRKTGGWRFNW